MYTRNYRQINNRPEIPLASAENVSEQIVDQPEVETELPPGYSGTALLRDRDEESGAENVSVEAEPQREVRRVRRYKLARDIKHSETCDDEQKKEPQNECLEFKEVAPVKPCLRERIFSIEDMLLSALIVLLLSEGADDMTVLILGFLLISEL